MENEQAQISKIKSTEELTKTFRGNAISIGSKIKLALTIWVEKTNKLSSAVISMPHMTEFILEWIVSSLLRSTKPTNKGPKLNKGQKVTNDIHLDPEAYRLLTSILSSSKENSNAKFNVVAEQKVNRIVAFLTTTSLLPIFVEAFALNQIEVKPFLTNALDAWCALNQFTELQDVISSQVDHLAKIANSLMSIITDEKIRSCNDREMLKSLKTSLNYVLLHLISVCKTTSSYRKTFQMLAQTLLPSLGLYLSMAGESDECLDNINELIRVGLFRVDTLQNFSTIIISQSVTTKSVPEKKKKKSADTSADTNRTIQSYQRQLFDSIQELFDGHQEHSVTSSYTLLPVILQQFLLSISTLHPSNHAKISQLVNAVPISLCTLRELSLGLFKRLIEYVWNRPKSPELIRSLSSMFKTYYTNVYFGTVSNISFVNDHVLASQEALLCDWVTQIITPELESILRKADPDPEENEAALPSLTYLIGSIDVLLEANPHTVLENLVNIVPALMSVDPNLGEIVNKLFTKMVQTLSMTRQLDVYFSKLALSFKEQNVAFSNDRHYSISSATHLRSLAKATSESMPFAQAIPTARYLMEMLSEITQATMTKKSENHIEMSHLTLALLLTHLVLGATQNNLTPTQCDSWQEFLEWSYLEISGIMIRTQGADQNDLVKWLYLYIHHTWVDIGSRLGGNDEWLETHIQPSALEPYISLTEWQAGTKNLNSQPRSYQIYMLSLYTLLQAFAYSQTTSCLGTEDIANTISLENRKSKYREQWVQKLTIVLKHFCIWSENGLLSNQDQCGWMPWDGLPHTINAGNFGTAQYRLFSDWLELICAFSDAPTCLEAVTTIMRLVFITSAKNSTTTQSLPKDANFVTPMTISLKLLSSADFYETTQVQKVFTRALASTLNNALREIVGVVNPKCQVLKKVETITGYLCSGANAKTEALRKGLVKFTAELYTNKAKPQKDLWISQIFWASKVTKRPSSDADSHGDKISHKVIALEEILLTLHRFPLACISIDHILALSLYLVTIDREISELCTQHWKETCPSWSYDDQFYTHQKVESVMVSCRSWILRACEASQSVLSTLTGMDWVFKWIFRSATTSNNRSLLDLSGRLLSSFVMCKMGETAPKGSSSNIISKLRFSTTISEELDPFITSEKCSLNITSLHIRCLEAALKYFGSKREKSHEDLGEFVSQELDTVVEKIIKFASNSDEFTEAVKNGILAAQLSQYNLLLKAKGHDKMAIQTMDAIIAKLSNRTSKMLNEPRGSGDFENALLSFGCDLCIFAANSIDRITIKDSNNEEPIPNSISGRIARFLALNILILSAANESRETYSYGNTSTSCITSLATQGKPNLGYAEIILQYSFNQALRSLDANMLELIMGQLLTIATTAQDASRNQAAIDMVKICISAANRPLNSKVSETHKCIQKRALEVLATIELVLARCNRLSVTESALDAVLEIVAGSGVRLTPHIISVVINVLSTITQRPQIATGFAVPNSETFELLYKKIIVILSRIIRNHASEAVKTIPSIITLLRLLLHAFVVPSLWDNVTRESHNSFVLKSPWIIAYAPFSASCATEYARFLEYLVHSHTSELTKSSLIRPTGPNSAQYGQYTTSRAYARGTRAGGMAKMLSRYVPYLLSEYCAIQGGAAILPTPPPSGMHAFSSTHSDEGQHPSRRFQGMAWRPSLVDMTNLEIEKQMHEIKQDTHVTKKKYQKYQKGLISDPEIREALLPGWYALLDIINDEGRAMVIAAFNPASMLGSQNGSIHIPASLGGAREVLRSLHHDYLQYHKYSGQF